jgi:hypothetical protein
MAQYAVLIYAHDSAHAPEATQQDLETCDNHSDELVDSQIRTGKEPTSISMLPTGRQAYVTDSGDGTVEILNFAK